MKKNSKEDNIHDRKEDIHYSPGEQSVKRGEESFHE